LMMKRDKKWHFIHDKVKRRVESCSQFHQHFMSSFGTDILVPKNHKAKL